MDTESLGIFLLFCFFKHDIDFVGDIMKGWVFIPKSSKIPLCFNLEWNFFILLLISAKN